MMRIAVVGANGFIGSRTVEMLHLEGLAEVRPVVRRRSSLTRAARFDLDCRIADAKDERALADAVSGCDVVLHAVAGDRATIVESAAATYRASERAGVRRLVYLSTASVHGQAPEPGSDETTPLPTSHDLPYNESKARAERELTRLHARGSVELVMLRPGIVFGPRSQWTAGIADELLAGRACLANDGAGICNTIYVDNLVRAIMLAATAPDANGEIFLVGDRERVTWLDLYGAIAASLGIGADEIPRLVEPVPAPRWAERLERVLVSRTGCAVLSLFPREARARARRLVPGLNRIPPAAEKPTAPREPFLTREMALLQSCRYKLPIAKAEAVLGYDPPISFAEGCRRSAGWLAFAGYPVVEDEQAVPEAAVNAQYA